MGTHDGKINEQGDYIELRDEIRRLKDLVAECADALALCSKSLRNQEVRETMAKLARRARQEIS